VAEGVAEVVARVAVRRGGRIGVTAAGGDVTRVLPPRGGRAALAAVRALLAAGVAPDAAPDAGPAGGTAFAAALHRVGRLARSRGAVVVVSDFRDEGWAAPLRALAARHTAIAVEVVDPREAALPDAGQLVLVDPESGRLVEADTSSARLREGYAAAEAGRREALRGELRRAGCGHVVLSTGEDWLRDLGRALR
jgi:uncharacterized protein (DUF58 family)